MERINIMNKMTRQILRQSGGYVVDTDKKAESTTDFLTQEIINKGNRTIVDTMMANYGYQPKTLNKFDNTEIIELSNLIFDRIGGYKLIYLTANTTDDHAKACYFEKSDKIMVIGKYTDKALIAYHDGIEKIN